jgi:hypothetical protein
MDGLVIDSHTVEAFLRRGRFEPEWFNDFTDAALPPGVVKISTGSFVYFICAGDVDNRRFLVLKLANSGFFTQVPDKLRGETFARMLQAGLSYFDKRVTVPSSWVPYRVRNRLTFYASRAAIGDGKRIVMETGPLTGHDVYIDRYSSAKEIGNLETYRPDYDTYVDAIENVDRHVEAAIRERESSTPTKTRKAALSIDSLELQEAFPQFIDNGLSIDEWYELLTKEQRAFVDAPVTGPMRLRGAAGTGKTLTMIVKALHQINISVAAQEPTRILFLTHSWTTAELVRRVATYMDRSGTLDKEEEGFVFKISTLQNVASDALNLNDPDLRPISEDGYEGKMLQLLLVEEILENFKKSDWIIFERNCSNTFSTMMGLDKDSQERRQFAFNLMNEFAYVIGSERSMGPDRYLSMPRTKTMMQLETDGDRRAVFHLSNKFRDVLVREKVLGVHHVMSDFLRQLDFNVWQRKRVKEGYDIVFVDEFHLFNQQETMTFQYLTKNPDPPHCVIMALDPKQSPGEAWFGLTQIGDTTPGTKRFVEGLKGAESVTLNKVFRYSSQIGALIKSINEKWPGIDFGEETDTIASSTESFEGEIPGSFVLPNADTLYKAVFATAKASARNKRAGSAKVAVLCMDRARFNIYVNAGQYSDDFITIRSRDDMEGLSSVGKKFVVTMPEYAAGLQFEEVFLVDANENLIPKGMDSALEVRRMLSNLYLGVSRAQKKLGVYATTDAGGLTRQLNSAVGAGLLAARKS